MHKESIMQPICDRELHEECGVFGVVGVPDAANLTYYGLHSLQHRGQEGCGIVSVSKEGAMRRVRGEGLVTEVFKEAKLANLAGDMAIGHVRYSTAGGGGTENIQPFLFHHNTGDFALAHNGNIVNADLLRNYLENKGSLFQSTSDSEVFAHLIKKEVRNHNRPRIYSIIEALNMLEGAFAFLVMTANRIYACRDKHGLRPLSIGKLGDGYVVSSETCAFEVVGAEFVRDVEPGEIVTIDRHGIRSSDYSMFKRHMMCAMEYIYFARPDSIMNGQDIYRARLNMGRKLWEETHYYGDVVMSVPDSGNVAALGYSAASGIPFVEGLLKNKYMGRTFIQPGQKKRERAVRMKLNPIRMNVEGKRIILVDDSIVRGTTSGIIINLLKNAGAKEIKLCISSPPVRYPCFFGIDTAERKQLIAAKYSTEEIRKMIGADALHYLSQEGLAESISEIKASDMCFACFDGVYPEKVPHNGLGSMEDEE